MVHEPRRVELAHAECYSSNPSNMIDAEKQTSCVAMCVRRFCMLLLNFCFTDLCHYGLQRVTSDMFQGMVSVLLCVKDEFSVS